MRRIWTSSLLALLACVPAIAGSPAPEARSDWLTPLSADQWNVDAAAHLLSRAGFGGTPEQVLELSLMRPEKAVASLVDYESLPKVDPLRVPEFDLNSPESQRARRGLERRQRKYIKDQYAYYLKAALDQALSGQPSADDRYLQRLKKNKRFKQLSEAQRQAYLEAYKKKQQARLAKLRSQTDGRSLEQRLRAGDRLSAEEIELLVQYRVDNDLRKRYLQQYVVWVRNWWLSRMIRTRRPLEEKMTLFWHGHFATSYATVRNGYAMEAQNHLLREHATGDFGALVRGIQRDAAMLRYLDGDKNVKGKPNENFAREVMELFTLGKGNYTEGDIKEVARAFTGWTYDRSRNKKAGKKYGAMPTVVFSERLHDAGDKTFFGITGKHRADDIIRIILSHPQCSRYIVGKLFAFFVGQQPDEATREALAKTFRESNYTIKPVLRRIFRARGFYSARVVGAHIKSPTELVVGMLRQLGPTAEQLEARPDNVLLTYAHRAMGQMGQALLFPPNVKGWDGGKSWVNSATMLTRYNVPGDLLSGLAGQTKALKMRYAKKGSKAKMRRRNRGKAPEPLQLPLITRLANLGSAEAVVTHLEKRFLRVPLAPERRAKLLHTLTTQMLEGETFDAEDAVDRKRLLDAVLLLFSTPEYQLS